ncbi:MFS transporter [Okibacterium endophyticum]
MRAVAAWAYLPTLLFSVGEGALIPLIPGVATNLGATLAIAGVIAAMLTVGQLIGDIPSGWLVGVVGERAAMIGAAFAAVGAVVLAWLSWSPWVLGVAILILGIATAVFSLARHAFMTTYVPIQYRARALSTLGGVFRAGMFIGPLLAAPLIHLTGTTESVYGIMIAFTLAAVLVLILLRNPEAAFGAGGRQRGRAEPSGGERFAADEAHGLLRTVWNNRGALVRVGSGASLISAMRATRTVLLPLWAVSIGVSEANTALIIGLAGAVDFALFYVSGQVMDRFGRLWAAIPSMLGLGSGMLLLAFTHDLPSAVVWFIVAAGVLSVANGLSSGIIMTLGADLAPQRSPAAFLGAWRFTVDSGSAVAPLALAGITAAVSVSFAAGALGIVGFLGAWLLARNVPRYVPHPRRRPSVDDAPEAGV